MMSSLWSLPLSKFDGLPIRCAPGTHDAAAELIAAHVPVEGAVLDLAAGTGAFLARLKHKGFTRLNAVELDVKNFAFSDVQPISVDLNSDFSQTFDRQFDLVTAIEIIEHLDSPRHFLREIWNLLSPDGYLALSTPNIAHWVGRLRFAASGELRYFRERDYHHQRHISPIADGHMRLMLKEIGFGLVKRTTAGSFWGPLKRAVAAPATLMARTFLGPVSRGDVCVYLVQKTGPDSESEGRSSLAYVHRHD